MDAPRMLYARPRNLFVAGFIGSRPEDMEDAALVHDGPEEQQISAVLELREDMGPEVYAHFTIDGPPVLTDDTRDLAVDAGDEALAELEERASEWRMPFTARFNAHSGVRESDRLDVFVEAAEMHFFDPESGEDIYADDAA